MYLEKEKIIFVHVPKCAGTSIENSLKRIGSNTNSSNYLLQKNKNPFKGPPSLGHLRARDYVKKKYLTEKDWNECFKFTFVRNPFARLVSIYNYRSPSFRSKFSMKPWNFENFISKFFPHYLEENYFKGHDSWSHVQPMWKTVCSEEKKILVDFVGRVENIEEDFNKVKNKLGFEEKGLKIYRENASKKRDPISGKIVDNTVALHWPDYYNRKSANLVRKYYSDDFKIFNYSKEIP